MFDSMWRDEVAGIRIREPLKVDGTDRRRTQDPQVFLPASLFERLRGRFKSPAWLLASTQVDGVARRTLVRPFLTPDLSPDTIRLDQTARHALMISREHRENGPIELEFARVRQGPSSVFGQLLNHYLLRQRTLQLRVVTADISDAEQELCRVTEAVFPTLGCQEGDILHLRAPGGNFTRSTTLPAYMESDAMVLARRNRTRTGEFASDRYPYLPRIALDSAVRDDLGLKGGDVVLVRRSALHQLGSELRNFGVTLALTILAAGQLTPISFDSWIKSLLLLAISVGLAVLVTVLNVRSRAK